MLTWLAVIMVLTRWNTCNTHQGKSNRGDIEAALHNAMYHHCELSYHCKMSEIHRTLHSVCENHSFNLVIVYCQLQWAAFQHFHSVDESWRTAWYGWKLMYWLMCRSKQWVVSWLVSSDLHTAVVNGASAACVVHAWTTSNKSTNNVLHRWLCSEW